MAKQAGPAKVSSAVLISWWRSWREAKSWLRPAAASRTLIALPVPTGRQTCRVAADGCPRATQRGRPALSAGTPNAINALRTPSALHSCGLLRSLQPGLPGWVAFQRENRATVPATDAAPVRSRAQEPAGQRLAHRGPRNPGPFPLHTLDAPAIMLFSEAPRMKLR